MNRLHYGERFVWQAEYGAFSIRRQEIGKIVRYVLNQELHHQSGDLVDDLERW